jgi:hypothetical protein
MLAGPQRSGPAGGLGADLPGPAGLTGEDHVRQLAQPRACKAAVVTESTPYALCHSVGSLLLDEGRSVVRVACQPGHDARVTLTTYGHVVDELDDASRVAAEAAIRAARNGSCVPVFSRRPRPRKAGRYTKAEPPMASGDQSLWSWPDSNRRPPGCDSRASRRLRGRIAR